ncbi:MAG: ABC transporter ATP-binding protein [Pseudomonadota bacterium]
MSATGAGFRHNSAPMVAMIEARNLVKTYTKVEAVRGVSFSVPKGQCFGLLGPNGAGKTTTVEMMEGITAPTSGEILYRGERLGQQFKEEAGIQFQATALQDFLTVKETLALFRDLYGTGPSVDELIEVYALQDIQDRDNRKLSGGQRQRMLLAIAMVNDPTILFLDEPTTGLDPQARRNFWRLIENVKAQEKTVLLTTHYMDEAYMLCDQIVIMDHGKIIAQGSPEELLKEHFDDVVLQLPQQDLEQAEATPPFEVHTSDDLAEISTADVSGTLKWLDTQGVPMGGLKIRPRTLEDLFIELTGKDLRS